MQFLFKTLRCTILFMFLLSFSINNNAQPDAPDFLCLGKSGNELVFTWQNNGNCGADFIATRIFEGATPTGPFTEIFVTTNANTNSINVINTTPSQFEYYFIQTECTSGTADSEILDELLPPPVTINSVTVNAGLTMLSWEPAINADAFAYLIYRINEMGLFQLVDTVLITDLTIPEVPFYIDASATPETQVEEYSIATMDFCGNSGSVLQSIPHSTMFLNSNIDTANLEITLNWTPYMGWETDGGVQSYRIFKGFEEIVELPSDQFTYTYQITNEEPQPLIFTVGARKTDGVTTSNSNQATIDPEAIIEVGVDLIDLNKVTVYPNPSAMVINLEYDLSFKSEEFLLYDSNARLVKSISLPQESSKIAISIVDLIDGIYYWQLAGKNGKVLVNH